MQKGVLIVTAQLLVAVALGCGNSGSSGTGVSNGPAEATSGDSEDTPKTGAAEQVPEAAGPEETSEVEPGGSPRAAATLSAAGTLPEAPTYPGSAQFCRGSLSGAPGPSGEGGGHISWEAYHSDDLPTRVVAHYMATLGSQHHKTKEDGHTWHIPLNGGESIIGVWPATAKGPWSEFDPPPSHARTIIMISVYAD